MLNTLSRRVFLQLLGSSTFIATLPWALRAAIAQSPHYEVFEAVEKALGHSVFYDEYKGNFVVAKQIADKIVRTARQSGNSTVLADALTALAKVQLLQGDAAAALITLAEAKPLASNDPVRQFRLLTFSHVAKIQQELIFPDGTNPYGSTWMAYIIGDYHEQLKPLKDQVNDPGALLEKTIIFDHYENLPQIKHFLRSAYFISTDQIKEGVQWMINNVLTYRQQISATEGGAHLLAHTDLGLAELYRLNHQMALAHEYLSRAKSGYQQSADWGGLAVCLLTEGDWAAAPFTSPQVLNHYIESSVVAVDSEPAWWVEAKELDITGRDLNRAKELYQKAQLLFEKGKTQRGLAALQLRDSYLAAMTDNYPQAIQKAQGAQSTFTNLGDHLGSFTAMTHHLLARIGDGELLEDREAIAKLGQWGTTTGSHSHALGLGLMIGRAARHWLLRAGDYEKALASYRLAESLFATLGATTFQAKNAADQGRLLLGLGEYTEAISLLDKAIQLYQATRAENHVGIDWNRIKVFHQLSLLNDLFMLHMNRDDPDAMELILKKTQALTDQLPAPDPQHIVPEYALFETLIERYAQGLIQLDYMVPTMRLQKARERGDKAAMKQLLEVALTAVRKAPPGQREFNEAMIYAYAHDYHRAKPAFQRYLDQGGANAGISSDMINLMSLMGGERAVQEIRLQKRRTHEQAFSFFQKIKAYEAAQFHVKALESLAGRDWWQSEAKPWETLNDYAATYEGLGSLAEAINYYDLAISQLEARRQQISRDQFKTALANSLSAQSIYFGAARTTLKLADKAASAGNQTDHHALLAKAYYYAERGKARGLLDLMANRAGTLKLGTQTSPAVRSWHEVNAKLTTWHSLMSTEQSQPSPSAERIAYLQQHIDKDEEHLRQVEQTLAKSAPNFYQAINPQVKVLDFKEIASHLPSGAALIQYYFGSEDLLTWVISHDGQVHAHRGSVDGNRLNRQIEFFHRACEQRTSIDSLGNELSQLLLAPLADFIAAHTRLLIVPFGKMHLLPFQSLPFKGQPLVASHSISYLPSASTLQFMQIDRSLTATNRVLAIGNPANMSYQPRFARQSTPQPALAAAEKEAFYVAQLFPQGRTLIGKQATKDAVRNAVDKYPILHFATHGILSDESPLLSSILLADGEALTVYELMGLHLNADLVVLSACRTAQGEVTRGDDVLGLTRGLLSAGARAAVTTLWPVDDLATSLLMEQFYQHLRDGVPAASALQKAQNKLRNFSEEDIKQRKENVNRSTRGVGLSAAGVTSYEKNYSDPYFWAAFMLVG